MIRDPLRANSSRIALFSLVLPLAFGCSSGKPMNMGVPPSEPTANSERFHDVVVKLNGHDVGEAAVLRVARGAPIRMEVAFRADKELGQIFAVRPHMDVMDAKGRWVVARSPRSTNVALDANRSTKFVTEFAAPTERIGTCEFRLHAMCEHVEGKVSIAGCTVEVVDEDE